MARIFLVRHGRAAAGWDTAMDPPLDDLGREQSAATAAKLVVRLQDSKWSLTDVDVVTSPLLRCRQTAAEYERVTGAVARVEPRIAEIPSPDGVDMADRVTWLRRAMQGAWAELIERDGDDYAQFRHDLLSWAVSVRRDTIAFSHFVAINALIGAATGDDRLVIRSVDNASITVLGVTADADGGSGASLSLLEGGAEANTLIR
ncbi:MAG: histidine phosphatase family protein [Actinomycetota bacterium]|nr:histidine phosphatase family protein [Actinomycetota bacterium]MBM3816189.1 histidine phosphatase family protein [Actinomycetota bacterium]